MSGKKLHFGMIGAGRIGKRAFMRGDVLASPVAGGGDRLYCRRGYRKTGGDSRGAMRHSEGGLQRQRRVILGDSKVEAVLICTSTGTHADLIVQAAKAGKRFFCEKPDWRLQPGQNRYGCWLRWRRQQA